MIEPRKRRNSTGGVVAVTASDFLTQAFQLVGPGWHALALGWFQPPRAPIAYAPSHEDRLRVSAGQIAGQSRSGPP